MKVDKYNEYLYKVSYGRRSVARFYNTAFQSSILCAFVRFHAFYGFLRLFQSCENGGVIPHIPPVGNQSHQIDDIFEENYESMGPEGPILS